MRSFRHLAENLGLCEFLESQTYNRAKLFCSLSTEWVDYVEEPMKYQALRPHPFSVVGGWRVLGVGGVVAGGVGGYVCGVGGVGGWLGGFWWVGGEGGGGG